MTSSRLRIEALQRLAALHLDAAQRTALQHDLDALVTWLTALPAPQSRQEEDDPVGDCPLRQDDIEASLPQRALLQIAPEWQDGFLRVPRFLDRDT